MNTQMRGSVPEASGEAPGPEGDDSNMGTVPTSGPEATSSQGKHTPGPWRLWRRATNHSYNIESKDVLVARMVGANDTVTANARLIAAAPDLLAALQRAHTILLGLDPYGLYANGEGGKAIAAAIAKATQP